MLGTATGSQIDSDKRRHRDKEIHKISFREVQIQTHATNRQRAKDKEDV